MCKLFLLVPFLSGALSKPILSTDSEEFTGTDKGTNWISNIHKMV